MDGFFCALDSITKPIRPANDYFSKLELNICILCDYIYLWVSKICTEIISTAGTVFVIVKSICKLIEMFPYSIINL